ncbi:MAG: dTMP kinase [Alphaproteobacteria bacterium]|nr:dTMP kinase [Alphaproteobacteria bacterium]MDE2011732.1 dTMP kinase [Alphaproteobacteria bacterium]MDE2072972.1 dTMP kinase [Alphaproteobacteria bacterium]
MTTARGRFITLEGGEGTGKSTQVRRLCAALEIRGIAQTMTREPGGSPGAEDIRRLLVDGEPGRWTPLAETLLLFAARSDHIAHTIEPALAAGRWVVCDRFTDSTYAYQGMARGLARETIRRIEAVAVGKFTPDLTLILDLPTDQGLARAAARGPAESRFEKFDNGFHESLRQAFLDIARRHPERCVVIDASGSAEEVAGRVWAAVAARFRIT